MGLAKHLWAMNICKGLFGTSPKLDDKIPHLLLLISHLLDPLTWKYEKNDRISTLIKHIFYGKSFLKCRHKFLFKLLRQKLDFNLLNLPLIIISVNIYSISKCISVVKFR